MIEADRAALVQLNDDFCFELDRGSPEGFTRLFAEDAHYSHGSRASDGRGEILAFARSRTACGPRTSRHVQTGLRLTSIDADRAEGISCCVTWAASTSPPIADTAVLLVADFHDRYVRVGDHWLFARRHIEPIFVPKVAHG